MSASNEPLQTAEQALWSRSGASPTTRFLDLASGRRVRIQEVGAGPPALFVHGVMTAGSAFAPLVARIRGMRCIVLDRPGCGLSEPWQLEPEFRDQAVGLLREVLDALELETVVLVGNSLGALWVTWFALAHPERVRKLVLLGPSIGFPGVRVPAFMRIAALPGVGAMIKRKMQPSRAFLRRMFASLGHRKSLDAGRIPDELLDWGVRLGEAGTPRRDFDAVLRVAGLIKPRRWARLDEQTLRALAVPTLLIAGTDDTHGGPALASRAAQLIRGSRLETLADAGHIPWLDDAAAVAEHVQRFSTEPA